ncbi:mucin-5AC-like [Helicoverpa zea]|uniref:mucin-5AC-like n=1 Tax=Helicoverpa zea TaxID=7113 RepID=UPI001F5ACB1D|nr:mucin-5AC-like [Helicoverpa zea]
MSLHFVYFISAARRNFLRRTKATAPPDTTETESSTDKLETTTNKFTRRGNSKFKSRKEAELEKKGATAKNEVENASRRPSLNGGARRSERPTRKFVRARPGGANVTTSTAAPSSASASSALASSLATRRPFRVASRRRVGSTTSSTTTSTTTEEPTTITAAPQAVTNAYEDEESLQDIQDIGDTDAIEDPTLEPKAPKRTNKVQRRPLVNLKEDVKDQNPSATNEEENKRQSKKYSATIKQIQLNDLLKLKSQEETTTEAKTTVEEISPETALAIAAHQLITAPIPSIPDFEEDVKPTRKTQTTVEYKYTSREYNEYTDISRTPTYDDYQSTPIYKNTAGSFDQTTVYRNPTDFDSTKVVTDFEAPKSPTTSTAIYKTDYAQTTSDEPYNTAFDAPKISTTTYNVPKSTTYPNTVNTANTANLDFIRTNPNDYTFTSEFDNTKVTPSSFSPRSPTTNFANTATNQEFIRTTLGDAYDTRSDFDSKISTYLPKATATNFPTNTVPQEYIRTTGNTFPETSTEFVSKTSPTYVPKFPTSDYQNTINQEYVRTTLNSYETPTELTGPKISTTLAPATPTRYFERTTFADTPTENSPRISSTFVPKSTATTQFSRNRSRYSLASTSIAPTGFTSRSSTPRYRTEKLIPVPVENTGYSTVGYSGSSSEPSYFTREYLLESPVTKTYDEEYQYLSPITTPVTPTPPTVTPRKVIRKKIQRKISTTLRPTEPPSSTTVIPRRSKKPFEKIPKAPKKTYRPIANYDYYDDSDEKVAVKYVEGTKIVMHDDGHIECLDIGNFPHPKSCKKFISCARIDNGSLLGWEYICPKGLSFDPVGGICNWSAGLGCDEKDI